MEQNLEKGIGGNGWVKIHRKIMDKGYYKHSAYVHLWLHLLLLANHKEAEFMWNGKIEKTKSGQFITGRINMSQDTGIPQSTIEDILKVFENDGQIRQQKTTKFRLITILNWSSYQQSDNKATTEQQQSDTNKNNNNNKKILGGEDTKEFNRILSLFNGVNPMFENLFGNTTERKALKDLIDKFGKDKIEKTIMQLPEIINKPYAPKITKPTELLRDLGKLVAFTNQEKNKLTTNIGKGFV